MTTVTLGGMTAVRVQIWREAATGFYRLMVEGANYGLSPNKEQVFWGLDNEGQDDGDKTYHWEEVKEGDIPTWAVISMVALAYSDGAYDPHLLGSLSNDP